MVVVICTIIGLKHFSIIVIKLVIKSTMLTGFCKIIQYYDNTSDKSFGNHPYMKMWVVLKLLPLNPNSCKYKKLTLWSYFNKGLSGNHWKHAFNRLRFSHKGLALYPAHAHVSSGLPWWRASRGMLGREGQSISSVLMEGKHPDTCAWFQTHTSTIHYADKSSLRGNYG